MLSRFSKLTLGVFMGVGFALCACDAPANETAAGQTETTQVEGAAPMVEETLSGETPVAGDVVAEGSMGEESPAGEEVTEQELPQSDVPPPSREVFVTPECEFEEWMGKPVDEAAIKATGRVYRILKPGSMMTMDHSPQRINVEHDDNGIVTRVWCG